MKQGELPGISQYSVFMFPDIGSDVSNVNMRWVELDGHPREDHSFNSSFNARLVKINVGIFAFEESIIAT